MLPHFTEIPSGSPHQHQAHSWRTEKGIFLHHVAAQSAILVMNNLVHIIIEAPVRILSLHAPLSCNRSLWQKQTAYPDYQIAVPKRESQMAAAGSQVQT